MRRGSEAVRCEGAAERLLQGWAVQQLSLSNWVSAPAWRTGRGAAGATSRPRTRLCSSARTKSLSKKRTWIPLGYSKRAATVERNQLLAEAVPCKASGGASGSGSAEVCREMSQYEGRSAVLCAGVGGRGNEAAPHPNQIFWIYLEAVRVRKHNALAAHNIGLHNIRDWQPSRRGAHDDRDGLYLLGAGLCDRPM